MNETVDGSCLCICHTPDIITIFSILGVIIPLLISEILPLSNCEANGIVDGLVKLMKIRNNNVSQGNIRRGG